MSTLKLILSILYMGILAFGYVFLCKWVCLNIPTSKATQRIRAIQNIEYKIQDSEYGFLLNKIQSKILDYYLKNPDFTDEKALARKLKISYSEIRAHICRINGLTGLFLLKTLAKMVSD